MREDVIRAVETYLTGIGARDLSAVPFHPDVSVQTPLGPAVNGEAAVRQAIASLFPLVKGLHIVQHLADDEWCATMFDFEYTFGTFRIIDWFHVVDGQIVSVQAFYDPRPVLDGLKPFIASR